MTKKTYNGAKNSKERSMQKLVEAVGTIIRTQGYTGLNALNIGKTAGVNRGLINLYFGSLDNLVEVYVRGKDYWVAAAGNAGELMEEKRDQHTREILESLLVNQLNYFYKEDEMQKIVLWQLSQRSKIMYEVAEEREKLGEAFFNLADPYFENTDVDLRAVAGLLVGGIYYMVLHAKANDSLFCQIDVNSENGLERIKKAISAILTDTYKRAENAKT
ncbi:transcriptional regulator, TetR family [Mucilaginibacter mallensis]|uniref:Transcriptional regulator, TetR family n=1 Tax=Mucilaginibacter mallensis TaxID=652787 RepID=A0A1H2CF22_MUCMA|nr:TetR/AcrR family transcriptional regulator [Mucilaginibacter mallensis]SDT68706.1 transcriptional regulator, TetR family [Mucilaginibacter mallensis]